MAEDKDNSQEKTEQPTQKRLQDARKEGQVARSKELSTMALLMLGVSSLFLSGHFLATKLAGIMRLNFAFEREIAFDTARMFQYLGESISAATFALLPLFITLLLVGLASPILVGGWIFSGKSLLPKLNRIDPLSGLKRMFSLKSLVELIKAIAKVLVVTAFVLLVLFVRQDDLLALGKENIMQAIVHGSWILGWASLAICSSLILIALIDVPFQVWEHQRKLKMTKQEIKDEFKDTEGKPEVKSRIRQLQRDLAQQRMMAEVPKADVVITNPTHFSVALKYDPEQADAPYLIAKGADEVALKIREIAKEHEVVMLEAPPLSRAIYYNTKINQQIPTALYMAVAQVLAYVYQLKQYRNGQGQKPGPVPKVTVPDELQK
ncbi:flagellar type III secretion system protein FlhB [Endozoicomonas sp. SM1973]|uniref:Flagellar biosynthetic protein FlhB n=1 Tax=Spartinivicinus marinus TaxID=2994442 RepID=A0A853I6C5_9GAMM|nr:flagellar biosynthesis protein FlhB [Spartinivicinus marinus]MCX4028926.1 flagellar biosynthesis protein FlhB [Spartinivicinus marinus]NYZ65491.1 flagellar type III secretion system protein FlhB [Spartinivicinus marinus]